MKQIFTIKTILLAFIIIGFAFSLNAQESSLMVSEDKVVHFLERDSIRPTVIAEYYPDPFDPNSPYVRIYWSGTGSYKVYRSDCYDTNPIMITQNITSGEYIDTNWGSLDPGIYMYGVRVNTEAVSWSNCLDKDMYSSMVSIIVLTGDGNSPAGTTVSFVNQNSTEQALYPMSPLTIDETGYYTWDAFRNGNYQVTLTKSGYETIVDEVEIWENSYSMSYTLIPSNAYSITVSANPSNGGTVTGSGYYQNGASCTVTATPANGYTFQRWTENGQQVSTQANYTFTVTGDRTLVAKFQAQSYTITATADPTTGGTVSGGGTFNYGQSCTLVATPATGYDFINWTKNGQQVSTNASYTFTVTGTAAYVAHFQMQTYNVNLTANPEEGGTVTGEGTYNYGQSVQIQATPNTGYDFVSWTENGEVISTEPNGSFTVNRDYNLVANFEMQTYDIMVVVDPADGGEVTGEGSYNYGDQVMLTVTPNEHYTFENWTEDGEVVCEELTYTFTATASRMLTVNLIDTEGVRVIVLADPEDGGFVTGGGVYPYGEMVTLTATAKEGYDFVKWTKNGQQVSADATYTFTVDESATYVALFQKQSFVIGVSAVPEEGGTVTGGGTFEYGETCILYAAPAIGFKFDNWKRNGVAISENPDYSFEVAGDETYTACFSQEHFTYYISASSSAHGSISPEGDIHVEPGETVTIHFTLVPEEGFKVSNFWIDDESVGVPKEGITFYNVNRNHTVYAEFEFLGVDENETQSVKVFPNPTRGRVLVECQGMRRITLYNLSGTVVYDKETHNDSEHIFLDQLNPGIYPMKVMEKGNQNHYLKLVIIE